MQDSLSTFLVVGFGPTSRRSDGSSASNSSSDSSRSMGIAYGTGKKTAADGTLTSSPLQAKTSAASSSAPTDETPEQRIARLEAENAALRAETTKLTTERKILQRAAKYFAGETRW